MTILPYIAICARFMKVSSVVCRPQFPHSYNYIIYMYLYTIGFLIVFLSRFPHSVYYIYYHLILPVWHWKGYIANGLGDKMAALILNRKDYISDFKVSFLYF